LAGIATLFEVDRSSVQACFRGEYAIVNLLAETWRPGTNPEELELVVGHRRLERLVEHLRGWPSRVRGRDPLSGAEDHARFGPLGSDLALRSEPRPNEHTADGLAEPRLRQQQEVIEPAPHDHEGCDHARLRRQEEGLARVPETEGLDVVRDHRLQIGGGVGTDDADEFTRSATHTHSRSGHAD